MPNYLTRESDMSMQNLRDNCEDFLWIYLRDYLDGKLTQWEANNWISGVFHDREREGALI